MAASLTGVLAIWNRAGWFIEKNLRFLVSFSAGVFLVVSYELVNETLHVATNLFSGLFWVAVGAIGIWFVFWLLPVFHHHHDEHEETHSHTRVDARRILMGDAIHNLGDGVLLAVAFTVSSALGVITAISIFVHELVQEVSEFFVLRQAGYSVVKAISINFAISSTILVGSIGGILLLDLFAVLETPVLGIAAGAFLVVVFFDLIPHSVRSSQTKTQHGQHLVWFLVGLVLMFGVNQVAVHSHGEEGDLHGHDHSHEEEEFHDEEIHEYDDEHDDHAHEEEGHGHEH